MEADETVLIPHSDAESSIMAADDPNTTDPTSSVQVYQHTITNNVKAQLETQEAPTKPSWTCITDPTPPKPSSIPLHIPVLPIELIPYIISSLYDQPESFDPAPLSDFARLTRVSKAFNRFASEFLYKDLGVTIAEVRQVPNDTSAETDFTLGISELVAEGYEAVHSMRNRNELARFVKSLVLDCRVLQEERDQLGMPIHILLAPNIVHFTSDTLRGYFDLCVNLHELMIKGFHPHDLMMIISKVSNWDSQITSFIIESSYLDTDLSILFRVLKGFHHLNSLVVYGHFDESIHAIAPGTLEKASLDSFQLESIALGSYAQELLPLISKGSASSLKSINLEIDACGWSLAKFSFTCFEKLEILTLVVGKQEDLNLIIRDLKTFTTLKDLVFIMRPRPATREAAEAWSEVDLTPVPRQMRFLDLYESPFPASVVANYGRGTKKGTGSMLWNDEMWTDTERQDVDKIWRERDG